MFKLFFFIIFSAVDSCCFISPPVGFIASLCSSTKVSCDFVNPACSRVLNLL